MVVGRVNAVCRCALRRWHEYGVMTRVWCNDTGLVSWHGYGVMTLVLCHDTGMASWHTGMVSWHGYDTGMVSRVYTDMVSWHWYSTGMVSWHWYGDTGMVSWHWYGVATRVWCHDTGMVYSQGVSFGRMTRTGIWLHLISYETFLSLKELYMSPHEIYRCNPMITAVA